jgi:putative transposase
MSPPARRCRIHRGMPRPPRVVLPGHTLHLIQRGNDRRPCFLDDDDRTSYLATLLRVSERAHCDVHAYVLMSNHVHLLVTAREASAPARMMHALGTRYVRRFNDRHERTGTLWEGRYRSSLIDSDRYFFRCSRYIETNPVRAGMVSEPAGYRWSSFRSNAEGEPDVLVRQHPVYLSLGQWGAARREAYRALFDAPVSGQMLDAIRRATYRGVPLRDGEKPSRRERNLDGLLSRT